MNMAEEHRAEVGPGADPPPEGVQTAQRPVPEEHILREANPRVGHQLLHDRQHLFEQLLPLVAERDDALPEPVAESTNPTRPSGSNRKLPMCGSACSIRSRKSWR